LSRQDNHPEKIGRYQILERVGRGGMGVLLRGVDPVLDREVAIKLMLLDFSEDAEQMRPRFYREARAAAKLQHPNIVTVFEFAEDGNTPYIVMEFLRGQSLQARMNSPLPMSLDEKLNVIAQLCTALNYAHEQGVVHRDIKPANIFLLPDGSVKLLDFGVAKLATSTLTRQGDVLGSASYMSPEQVSGGNVDGRSDIFSTGVVLYELLANRKPFHADTLTAQVVKLLREEPPSLDDVAPGLPPHLVGVVGKALAKEPNARFQTAGDLAKELQWIRQNLQSSNQAALALDETRFATPTQLIELQKTLDRDRVEAQQSGGGSPSSVQSRSAIIPAQPEKKWIVPAGIGAAVLAAGALAFMLMRGPSTPPGTTPGTTAPGTTTAGGGTTPGTPGGGTAAAAVNLQIESVPDGADIVLDSKPMNQRTPATVAVTGSGPHRLRLSKPGFVTQEITLDDAAIKQGAVSYKLVAQGPADVAVSIQAPYPVEVLSGGQSIARASASHRLRLQPGTRLRIVAKSVLLSENITVGSSGLNWQAPGVGYLTVLTSYETCDVRVGDTNLGPPPITRMQVAAGQYKVEMQCPDGKTPPSQLVVINPGETATARIR
jgi:serine/threonine-protein kinase